MAELEQFLRNLETLLGEDRAAAGQRAVGQTAAPRSGRDAIDAELEQPARITKVASLRDAAEIRAFEEELLNGLIRVDTANQLLRLVNELMKRVLT